MMKPGRYLLRAVIGGLFIGHGAQKLFGWFDGPGLSGTTAMMESLEMRPARENALAAGATEALGGAMVLSDTLMPLGATGLIATMITAIRKVHFKNGLWNSGGGYEFNLLIIAVLLALVDSETNSHSSGGTRQNANTDHLKVLAVLTAGAAGSGLMVEMGRRRGESEDEISES